MCILSRKDTWVCFFLTHWGRVTHICVSKLTIIGSDNGLSPGRRQAIISTNAGILLIGPLGTNFSENLIKIYTMSFRKMHLKISSGKWRPFCLGLKVLKCAKPFGRVRGELTLPLYHSCDDLILTAWTAKSQSWRHLASLLHSILPISCH